MSAGVGIWKESLLRAARIGARNATSPTVERAESSAAPLPSILALARQVFFPSISVQRSRVLFAAADAATNVVAICEQVGRALAERSGSTVAVVEPSQSVDAGLNLIRKQENAGGTEWWKSCSSRITENVWRVPATLMCNWDGREEFDRRASMESSDLRFDYVLFASSVAASETPLFCSASDGVVLVLTANRTRKESATRARDQLLQYNAELLGTVLEGRTFPVPEAIYRRL